MRETDFAQYPPILQRFFPSLGVHPMGENAKSRQSLCSLVETVILTLLLVDSGYKLTSFSIAAWTEDENPGKG